jgi:membrane protease YdiL (CAAX protease family)
MAAATAMRDWLAAQPPAGPDAAAGTGSGALRASVLIAAAGLGAQIAWLLVLAAVGRARAPRHAHDAAALEGARRPATLAESAALTGAVNVLGWPVLLLASAVAAQVEALWAGPAPRVGHATLEAMAEAGSRDPWWWASAGIAVVLAPLVEETLYRGCLQQALRRALFGRTARIVATAAVFSLLHWGALSAGAVLSGLVTLGLFGALLGYLYERTGRLAMCVATHALFNAVNLARL